MSWSTGAGIADGLHLESEIRAGKGVTVRLLPRWLGLEAIGEFGIVKEVIEEAVPGQGSAACFSKHI